MGPTGDWFVERTLIKLLAISAPFACASAPAPNARDVADANDTGHTFAAQTASERGLLAALARLSSGTAQQIGEALVVAEAPYDAASGRRCRALQVTTPPSREAAHRLACSDGKAWFFVPPVFGTEPNSSPE